MKIGHWMSPTDDWISLCGITFNDHVTLEKHCYWNVMMPGGRPGHWLPHLHLEMRYGEPGHDFIECKKCKERIVLSQLASITLE